MPSTSRLLRLRPNRKTLLQHYKEVVNWSGEPLDDFLHIKFRNIWVQTAYHFHLSRILLYQIEAEMYVNL